MPGGTAGSVPTSPDTIVDKLVPKYMGRSHAPGVAVALHYDQQDWFFPFGAANLATRQPVTEETIFEIGSVTKVFTATLLACQVGDGTRRLADPVTDYLPAAVTNPALRQVTLQTLATHTSGFPRQAGGPGGDALFADQPPSAELIDFWNSWSSTDPKNAYCAPCPVGTCWQYSNVGFVTLGFAVVGRPGSPQAPGYDDLLARLITAPLGMTATAAQIPPGAPVAQGYRGDKPTPVAGQAADLKSSAGDMLTWLKANLGVLASIPLPLAAALALTHETVFRGSQQCPAARHPIGFDMGLAWQSHPLRPGGPVVYAKDGATPQGGFSCWIGFVPARGIGLAVLTNHVGGEAPGQVGLEILCELAAPDAAR